MKIALIAPTYLPAQRANTIQVMKMAQAMAGLGHQVLVTVPGRLTGEVENWATVAHHYGLRLQFEIEWLPVISAFRSYDYGLKSVVRARRWGADYVYTRLPQAAALASFLGIATIYEVHDIPRGTVNPWLLHRFLRGRGARRLVLITRSLKESLAREVCPLPPAPFTLIAPDGVDLARYHDLPSPQIARRKLASSLLPPPSNFTAGYTGSLYTGRGVGLILALAAALPKTTFLLAGGSASDVERVGAEISKLGLENVILTGFVPNAELPLYQAACEALLMPYQRKVAASSGGDIAPYLSPMKLFEYLACGRAVLCTDLPVLREVLNDKNAILLPPDDLVAWADALQALQADPARRANLAVQARQDVKNYTWEARAERILTFD